MSGKKSCGPDRPLRKGTARGLMRADPDDDVDGLWVCSTGMRLASLTVVGLTGSTTANRASALAVSLAYRFGLSLGSIVRRFRTFW